MAETYTVTDQVIVDHPAGYQYIAHVAGDVIPMARAVELGLTRKPPAAKATGAKKTPAAKKAAGKASDSDGKDDDVVTAERRTTRS